MRKSILIGALCVLMLFAFTACEPQQMNWPYTGTDAKDVVNIELTDPASVKAYAGKSLDVDTYINIERLDDTVDTVIGTITFDSLKPGVNTVNVTWGNPSDNNSGKMFITADELTSLEVEYDVTKTVEDGVSTITDADTAKAGIVSVTGYYSDGTPLTLESYNVKLDGTTFTVSYSAASYTTKEISWSTEVTLAPESDVPEATTEKGDVTDIKITFTGAVSSTATSAVYTVGDTVVYTVTGVTADGKVYTMQEGDYVVEGDIPSTALTGLNDGKAYTATIYFVGDEGDANYGKNFAKTISVTVQDSLTIPESLTWYYKVKNVTEGEETKLESTTLYIGDSVTFTPDNFTAYVSSTVKKDQVTLTAVEINGQNHWDALPSSSITVKFSYKGTYNGKDYTGYGEYTVTPSEKPAN